MNTAWWRALCLAGKAFIMEVIPVEVPQIPSRKFRVSPASRGSHGRFRCARTPAKRNVDGRVVN